MVGYVVQLVARAVFCEVWRVCVRHGAVVAQIVFSIDQKLSPLVGLFRHNQLIIVTVSRQVQPAGLPYVPTRLMIPPWHAPSSHRTCCCHRIGQELLPASRLPSCTPQSSPWLPTSRAPPRTEESASQRPRARRGASAQACRALRALLPLAPLAVPVTHRLSTAVVNPPAPRLLEKRTGGPRVRYLFLFLLTDDDSDDNDGEYDGDDDYDDDGDGDYDSDDANGDDDVITSAHFPEMC